MGVTLLYIAHPGPTATTTRSHGVGEIPAFDLLPIVGIDYPRSTMEVGDRVRVEWELEEIEAEVTGFPEPGKISILLDQGDEVTVPAATVHALND
jgi:hypothetical protein